SSFTAVELISTPTSAGWLFFMTPKVFPPLPRCACAPVVAGVLDNGLFTRPQPFQPVTAHLRTFMTLVVPRVAPVAGHAVRLLYTAPPRHLPDAHDVAPTPSNPPLDPFGLRGAVRGRCHRSRRAVRAPRRRPPGRGVAARRRAAGTDVRACL